MPLDSNSFNKLRVNVSPEAASKWAQRRDIPIAILAWIAVGVVVLWVASYVIRTLLVLTVAMLLAFALLPAVKLLERARVPRVIAIVIVYLVVLSGIGLLLYLVATTTIDQIAALAK